MAKNKQQSPNLEMPVEGYKNLYGWQVTKKQFKTDYKTT